MEKELKNQNEIKAGDVIRVKKNNKEITYLICEDDERFFLVDLSNGYLSEVYDDESILYVPTIEEYLENENMELLETISSEQVKIGRI